MTGVKNRSKISKINPVENRITEWNIMRVGEEKNAKEEKSRTILMVTLQSCIWELPGLNFGLTPAILTKVFGSFLHALQVSTRTACQLGHKFLLPNSFNFIHHSTI